MCGTEAASDLRGGFFGGVRCKVGGRTEAFAPTEAIQEVRLARRRVREPRPYGGYKSCGTAGRCGHRPLRNRIMGCVGEGLCPSHGRGRTPPLRRGYKRRGEVRNPPVTASPCQPPLGKGALRTGDADCHDQFANWSRNDRLQELRSVACGGVRAPRPMHFMGCGARPGGSSGRPIPTGA